MKFCHKSYSASSCSGNPPIPKHTYTTAKLDSGASANYFRFQDATHCLDDLYDDDGPTAVTPTLETIKATKAGNLPLAQNNLSTSARKVHVFDKLGSASLVSVASMCDDGCQVLFDKNNAFITKNNQLLITGYRNWNDRLWDIRLPTDTSNDQSKYKASFQQINTMTIPPKQHSMSIILRKHQSKLTLAQYHHHTLFAPTEKTLRQAIKNNHLITWPGLTQNLLTKGLPASEATAKGHLRQQSANLQSTKSLLTQAIEATPQPQDVKLENNANDDDFFPPSDSPNVKTNATIFSIIDSKKLHQASMDLTGKFPYISRRGNQYILVGYHYDANYIAAIPIKKRTAGEITKGWQLLHERFSTAGTPPTTYVMDNETSKELLAALKKRNINYQLAPPHMHRTNAAERAIQTFKNHFTSGLTVCNSKYPMEEWDQLLDQAEISLNLLRSARSNPKLSAYAYLRGQFDYNSTPMAPPGTKVVVHDKPSNRSSWGLHGTDGWYIGPSLAHYRCVKCFMPATKSVRDADTVAFFPETIPFPETTIDDHLKQAATDIIRIITTPSTTTAFPTLAMGDNTRNALLKIAETINRSTPLPALQSPSPLPKSVTFAVGTKTSSSHRVIASTPSSSPLAEPTSPSLPPVVTQPTSQSVDASPPRVNEPRKNTQAVSETVLKEIHRAIKTLQTKYPMHPSTKPRRSERQRKPSTRYTRGYSTAATRILAQHLYESNMYTYMMSAPPALNHIYNDDGKKMKIHELMTNPETTEIWTKAMSNELGRLTKGNVHNVKFTDTIEFIAKSCIPAGRDITYANFVLDHRPLKTEPWRVRLTVGGDKLSYDEDPGSPAASLLETKLMLNSVISDAHKGARFMGLDLKDFFLATPMARPEFMRIHYKHFPDDIKQRYNIDNLVASDGYVYVKIKKGMYGLKQAAILAYENLVKNLSNHGYKPVPHSLGIWTHSTRPISFCLCVDDFGIKYFSEDDANHLITSLQNYYTVTIDRDGNHFCGLTIDWNYKNQYVDISMPNYIKDLLQKLQYKPTKYPQFSPHHFTPVIFGQKGQQQMATPQEQSEPLPTTKIRYVQSVVGSLLYYARAIDSTLLPALNDISKSQANPSLLTLDQCQRILDYANTYQHVKVRFHASDMILNVETDAAYLVLPKARSRMAGYFHMGYHRGTTSPFTRNVNGAVLVECKTITHVVSSAAEAETAGLYHNAQASVPIRRILIALGHSQPPTPIKTDNSTAVGFTYDNINQKRSKSWDMRYYWLRDRQQQQQFDIHWEQGKKNNADYFTKHHPTPHHQTIRSTYVIDTPPSIHTMNSLANTVTKVCAALRARGCVRDVSGLTQRSARDSDGWPVANGQTVSDSSATSPISKSAMTERFKLHYNIDINS